MIDQLLTITKSGKRVFQLRLTRPYAFDSTCFGGGEFVAMLINQDFRIDKNDRDAICLALVKAGCRYAVCFGNECSDWDDAVDWASLSLNLLRNEAEAESFVMTTWHENETIEKVASFFVNCTRIDDKTPENYLAVAIGECDQTLDLLKCCLQEL